MEFSLPDLDGRTNIFKIHARSMSVEKDIRYELLARLCPNSTGAELRSVCTEAGMFAIRWALILRNIGVERQQSRRWWFALVAVKIHYVWCTKLIFIWSGREGRWPLRRTSSTLCTRFNDHSFTTSRHFTFVSGDQELCQVLRHPQVHDLQLSGKFT